MGGSPEIRVDERPVLFPYPPGEWPLGVSGGPGVSFQFPPAESKIGRLATAPLTTLPATPRRGDVKRNMGAQSYHKFIEYRVNLFQSLHLVLNFEKLCTGRDREIEQPLSGQEVVSSSVH